MNTGLFNLGLRAVAAACLIGSCAANADYVWLEPSADGTRAFIGQHESANRADITVLNSSRAFVADGQVLPLKKQHDHLLVDPAPGDIRLTAQVVGQGDVLHFYQAKLGRSETKPVNDLELVPLEPNGNTFKLVWKGNAVAASQVNVSTSQGWVRTLKPAEDGTVTLTPLFSGLYVLEVTARVNGSATYQGKQYADVRHSATLSFEVQP